MSGSCEHHDCFVSSRIAFRSELFGRSAGYDTQLVCSLDRSFCPRRLGAHILKRRARSRSVIRPAVGLSPRIALAPSAACSGSYLDSYQDLYPGSFPGPFPGSYRGPFPGSYQDLYRGPFPDSYQDLYPGSYRGPCPGSYLDLYPGSFPDLSQGPFPCQPLRS
ncbi:hypothetical protein OMP40_36430 [Cohnella rhizosphaerae]|uniref:Uncharacterized protein n=1 Tax=Cohnella rhizosphaerae TaxID=1457232 RepID=A0A9X4L069_9BACL|nr:hypothetical protein [Cohnella rhizosphaerae]